MSSGNRDGQIHGATLPCVATQLRDEPWSAFVLSENKRTSRESSSSLEESKLPRVENRRRHARCASCVNGESDRSEKTSSRHSVFCRSLSFSTNRPHQVLDFQLQRES